MSRFKVMAASVPPPESSVVGRLLYRGLLAAQRTRPCPIEDIIYQIAVDAARKINRYDFNAEDAEPELRTNCQAGLWELVSPEGDIIGYAWRAGNPPPKVRELRSNQ